MDLYLLRHADAGDPAAWKGNDADRPLSDKGRGQAERLGKLLASLGIRPTLFLTSPKVRAHETATLAAGPINGNVDVDPRLGGALDPSIVDSILDDAGSPESIVIVGHDPDFSELLATLVGVADLPMKKGALARLDTDRPLRAAGATLRALIPPAFVPKG